MQCYRDPRVAAWTRWRSYVCYHFSLCTRTHTHTTRTRIRTEPTHAHTHTCTHAYTYTYTNTHTRAYVPYTHTHAHASTCTPHTYTHAYTHTHTQRSNVQSRRYDNSFDSLHSLSNFISSSYFSFSLPFQGCVMLAGCTMQRR